MKFFGKNIKFKNPQQVDIVIYDECNSQYVKKILDKEYSVGILKMRPYEIFITYLIIKNVIKNINKISYRTAGTHKRGLIYGMLFQLRAIYFEACLIAANPKAVITMIDNNSTFHWLSKYSLNFPYIAIQNGARLRHEIYDLQGYNLQHFFCWGLVESEVFKELGYEIKNYYPVGSLLASLYFNKSLEKSLNYTYDLLIVSAWRGNIGNSVDVIDTMKSMKIMDEILSAYLKEKKIKAAVILRSERGSEHWIIPSIGSEYDYYKALYGEAAEIIEANFDSRNIYPVMQQSRLIVSCLSSALNEAYGIGKKIFYFNYTGTKKYHCDIDPRCIIENDDLKIVTEMIDDVLSQPEKEYQKIHSDNMRKVMKYPDDILTNEVIRVKINEIIDQYKVPVIF